MFTINIEELKNPKISYIFEKHLVFLLFEVILVMKLKKYLKKKNQLKHKKFLI